MVAGLQPARDGRNTAIALPQPSTAEGPILWFAAQCGSDRITFGVGNKLRERLFVADQVIERLCLPEGTSSTQLSIDPVGSKRLPRMEDFRQGEFLEWRDDSMNMIWHHHPGVQGITFTLEVQKGILNDAGGHGPLEKARTRRKWRLTVARNHVWFVILIDVLTPQGLGGYCILEAEGNKIRATDLVKVREGIATPAHRERQFSGILETLYRQGGRLFVLAHRAIVPGRTLRPQAGSLQPQWS